MPIVPLGRRPGLLDRLPLVRDVAGQMSSKANFCKVLNDNIDRLDMNLGVGNVAVRLLQCPDSPSDIQDSALVMRTAHDSIILAVADGVGGAPGGRAAAGTVLNALSNEGRDPQPGTTQLRSMILDGIENANRKLLEQGRGAGTTVAVAEISDGVLRSYHAGDSEVLVVGQRGKLKLRVVPHSATGFAVEAGVLHEDDAVSHEERHLLLNVVGSSDMRIEIAPSVQLATYDTVLLATDGVLDNLYLDEIVEIVRCGSLSEAADELSRSARARMFGDDPSDDNSGPSKPDDLAIILFRQ
jgi:serine/threonine protein phosphatase PrpC